MRWIHATINAKLGDVETMSHTMNFRTAPEPDVDQSVEDIQLFANQLRDIWANWLKTTVAPETVAPSSLMGNHVQYVDVTAAYLEQTAPAAISTHTSRKTGHPVKDFTYPRPTYLVPTQYAEFDGTVKGTNNFAKLPYEVAMCVSFTTGVRGPRNRGRLYLGGLTTDHIDDTGAFKNGAPARVAGMFGRLIHTMNTGTGARLHVVSRAYATSIGINGVSVGSVPDSQRRRRRSQLENATTPVGT